MSTPRWSVDKAQASAVKHYRAWASRLIRDAQKLEAHGTPALAEPYWDAALVANRAADCEAKMRVAS